MKRLIYSPLLILGLVWFLLTKRTIKIAYISLRQLFCATNGQINNLLHGWLSKPKETLIKSNTDLKKDTTLIANEIKKNGYYIFPNKAHENTVEQLIKIATTEKCILTPKLDGNQDLIFDESAPKSIKYALKEDDMIKHAVVQNIISDELYIQIAENYFDSAPISDLISMWWSTSINKDANSKVAQLFHFDMDRIKWLKFFIYLTDVTIENGPHIFVKGSHKNLPLALREDRRFTDDEVLKHYGSSNIKEITAPKGTIIAVDTRGLHKGKVLETGHRLIFQIQYSSSLFGQSYNKLDVGKEAQKDFMAQAAARKTTFQRYNLTQSK